MRRLPARLLRAARLLALPSFWREKKIKTDPMTSFAAAALTAAAADRARSRPRWRHLYYARRSLNEAAGRAWERLATWWQGWTSRLCEKG